MKGRGSGYTFEVLPSPLPERRGQQNDGSACVADLISATSYL